MCICFAYISILSRVSLTSRHELIIVLYHHHRRRWHRLRCASYDTHTISLSLSLYVCNAREPISQHKPLSRLNRIHQTPIIVITKTIISSKYYYATDGYYTFSWCFFFRRLLFLRLLVGLLRCCGLSVIVSKASTVAVVAFMVITIIFSVLALYGMEICRVLSPFDYVLGNNFSNNFVIVRSNCPLKLIIFT